MGFSSKLVIIIMNRISTGRVADGNILKAIKLFKTRRIVFEYFYWNTFTRIRNTKYVPICRDSNSNNFTTLLTRMLNTLRPTFSELITYADQWPLPLLGFSFNGTAAMVEVPKTASAISREENVKCLTIE